MESKSFEEKVLETLKAQNKIANTAWLDVRLKLNKAIHMTDAESMSDFMEIVGKLALLRSMCKSLAAEAANLRIENIKLEEENEKLRTLV